MAAGRLLLPGWMPAVDSNGDPIPNAKVYFYFNKTSTLAPVYSDESLSVRIPNPVEANATGRFPAVWADGEVLYSASVEAPYGPAGVPFTYDNLSASLAAEIVLTEAAEAAANDAEVAYQNILDAIQAAQDADGDAALAGAIAGKDAAQAVVADKAARAVSVAAVASTPSGEAVVSTPFGDFQWISGDQSANVSADPEKGIWVAPTSAPSGSSGAWARIFDGPIDPVWFGGRTSASIQSALNYAKLNPKLSPIRATGVYQMTATVRYEGAYEDGIIFDGMGAEFRRSSDYGRTFYISGLADGRSLDRTTWRFGRLVDTNDSMTVANSRCHVTFDHVNFLEYQIREIVGGCGAMELLGCATTKPLGVQSWRMIGPYRGAGSRAMTVGRSEIASWAISGDHHGLGSTDIYCGRARQDIIASTVGTSATVSVDTVTDLAIGQLVSEHGLNGYNAYAKIPKGTTITAVDGGTNTITLSTAVDLSGGSVLVSYSPTLDYGIVVELADGIWDNEMTHVMFHKEAALYIHTIATWALWNIRIKIMGDWSPGDALRVDGDGQVTDGYVSLHHPYNGRSAVSIASTFIRFRVFSIDQGWSTAGFEWDGTVKARELVSRGEFGYSEHSWELAGVKRWSQYANADTLSVQALDGDGSVIGNAYDIDQITRSVAMKWPVQHVGASVADLAGAPFTGYLDGTEVLCYNCRVLTVGGALEPAGSGSGGKVWKRLGQWYVVGTNILAQS